MPTTDLSWLAGFVLASAVLVGLPGPNVLYICTRAAAHGTRVGLVSALGIETGTLLHAIAAALGVSAAAAAVPGVFAGLKLAGAGYLAYLGVRALRTLTRSGSTTAATQRPTLRRAYRDGVLVNVLNPKVALFFLAFLPQFVSADASGATLRGQMLALGAGVFVIALVLDLGYAVVAGLVAGRREARADRRWPHVAVATIYFGLATVALGSAS
jgi:threonine/homoserine/homoserine lactone efflux protein